MSTETTEFIKRRANEFTFLPQENNVSQVTTLKQKQLIWIRKIPRKSRFIAIRTLLQKLAIEDNDMKTISKHLLRKV